jgi:hypothetical protein
MSEHRVHLFVKITDWLITAITVLLAIYIVYRFLMLLAGPVFGLQIKQQNYSTQFILMLKKKVWRSLQVGNFLLRLQKRKHWLLLNLPHRNGYSFQ